jgi:hypothetical protein
MNRRARVDHFIDIHCKHFADRFPLKRTASVSGLTSAIADFAHDFGVTKKLG